MSDTPAPVALPAAVVVSPAQVWSAAAQNIVIAVCLTAAFMWGKLGLEVWIAGLGYITGVDLFGRGLARKGNAAAALAIGATGSLVNVGKGILALGVAYSLTGCASLPAELLPRTGNALLVVQSAHAQVSDARELAADLVGQVCALEIEQAQDVCEEVQLKLVDMGLATDLAADYIDAAAEVYNELNEAVK